MTTEFAEKRRFVRVPLSLSISGIIVEGFVRRHNFDGKTEDISYDGLCIEVSRPNGFNRHQKIKFETQLYKGDYLLKATGLVRWVDTQNRPEGTIRIGVKLVRIRHYQHWCERITDEIA